MRNNFPHEMPLAIINEKPLNLFGSWPRTIAVNAGNRAAQPMVALRHLSPPRFFRVDRVNATLIELPHESMRLRGLRRAINPVNGNRDTGVGILLHGQ